MMRIRFALSVIRIFMKNQMQNRTYILLDIINMIARCLIVFLLYGYVFKIRDGNINGADYVTSLWSMFIYFCIMTMSVRKIHKLIMDDVKTGNVELFLNKPVDYVWLSIYKTLGQGIYSFILISVIGCILMILFIGIPQVNLIIFIPTFVITLVLGLILGIIIYTIIGLLAFFMQDVRPIHWIVDKLIMVLGGSYLPVSLFPPVMKLLAFISPFGAINFATSTVYDSWNHEYIIRILLQGGWIIVFSLLLLFIYKKAREKAMINGG